MSLGLFVSAFATTEFQAVQFCRPSCCRSSCCAGSSWRATRWRAGSRRSDLLPLTYAYDALDRVTGDGRLGTRGAVDVAVIAGCTLLALALGAATLRRRTG